MCWIVSTKKGRTIKEFQIDFLYGTDVICALITPINKFGDPDPNKSVRGATYKSKKEEYNRRRGQSIALTRALDEFKPTGKFRKEIWEGFEKRFLSQPVKNGNIHF